MKMIEKGSDFFKNTILLNVFVRQCVVYFLTTVYCLGFCFWTLLYVLNQPTKRFWTTKRRDRYPRCLQDPVYGEHKISYVNGINVHYVEKGDHSKPLMLLVHGFPEFWYSWRHQLKDFSDDYWVVAPDLRGYGNSDKPGDLSEYHMSKILLDLRELVMSLGRKKFILVGHDWGGVLSWNFLDHYPEMVEKFVIINAPYTHTWLTVMLNNTHQFRLSWYCFFFQAPFLPETAMKMYDFRVFNTMADKNFANTFTTEDLEAYKYMFSRKGCLTSAINYYRANCGVISLKTKPPSSLPPGLFLFGENDGYLLLDYLEQAKKMINNLQTKIIKDSNHFVQQTNPLAVNTSIRQFLEGS